MKKAPLVTIVISFFNAEKYIGQCLKYATEQTYSNLEIICVDDGSTDKGYEIVLNHLAEDTRVHLIRQNNQYAGIARNTGLDAAHGEYISFWDADDIFDSEYIEKMLKIADSNKADIVVCDCEGIDDETGIRHDCLVRLLQEELRPDKSSFSWEDMPDRILQVSNCWVWDKLYRVDFVRANDIRFQGTRILNDAFFCCKANVMADSISICDEILVTHRTAVGNSLQSISGNHWKCAYEMLFAVREMLNDAGIYNKIERSYINLAATVLSYYIADNENKQCFEEAYADYHMDKIKEFSFGKYDDSFYYDDMICTIMKQYETMDKETYLFSRAQALRKATRIMTLYNLNSYRLYEDEKTICEKKYWMLPADMIPNGSHIIIYGFGDLGRDYYRQILDRKSAEIVCIIDKEAIDLNGVKTISDIKDIRNIKFDYIIIAIYDVNTADIIRKRLIEAGVPDGKILWHDYGVNKEVV